MTVMLDSVSAIRAKYGEFLYAAEWFFTILFTVEYIFRLLGHQRRKKVLQVFRVVYIGLL